MVLSVESVTFTWVPRDTDSFDRMKISLPPLWKLFRTEILSPLSLPDMTFPRFLLCLDATEAKSWIICLFMFFSSYQPEAEPSSTETESKLFKKYAHKTFQQVCSQTKCIIMLNATHIFCLTWQLIAPPFHLNIPRIGKLPYGAKRGFIERKALLK